jgi:hypothetical protein
VHEMGSACFSGSFDCWHNSVGISVLVGDSRNDRSLRDPLFVLHESGHTARWLPPLQTGSSMFSVRQDPKASTIAFGRPTGPGPDPAWKGGAGIGSNHLQG